jgi:cephalosporin hydroxylase/SAM-dependent methyltransferase
MKWFRPKKKASSQSASPSISPPLTEGEAVALAQKAKLAEDWPAALIPLERVGDKRSCGAEYHELRQWALHQAGRTGRSDAWTRHRFQGQRLDICPQDMIALGDLLAQVRPGAVLEVGSRGGGAALWMSTLCHGLGLGTRVHSADWGRCKGTEPGRVEFSSGDLRKPSSIWPGAVLNKLPQPALLIVRTLAGKEVTLSALKSMHKWLRKGDILCVEDDDRGSGTALDHFLNLHPVGYARLTSFHESFGRDSATPSQLSAFTRTGLDLLDPQVAPGLAVALEAVSKSDWKAGLDLLNQIKAERKAERGVDYLRALCFHSLGEPLGACEAAKEELRYFPDHAHAEVLMATMMQHLFPGKPKLGNAEFHEIYRIVRPYTMLSDERLYSLYLRTRLVCQMDLPGDMVECGVAAGGGSALIAATMARHSRRPRRLFSCDTFEGMPSPTIKDVAYGVQAEASGWGSGTCAAPAASLMEVCGKLGVSELVHTVKGFFKDTLPTLAPQLTNGIAFLHMDGDWYESTMDILVHLYDAVHARGFIQVDDYGHWEGCRQAMWDFAASRSFEFKVQVIDATGVWLQRPDRSTEDHLMLNLGCGNHFHRDWINLDIAPASAHVIEHDLAKEPLPFAEGVCSAVYHSHVLEHIPREQVDRFISECFRVLAPGGTLRIAVPDLEGIATQYLAQLNAGDEVKHEWMVVELVDQLARNRPGGEMLRYWQQDPMPAEQFVIQRLGHEVTSWIQQWRAAGQPPQPIRPLHAAEVGSFRLSGEVHQWMYDRLSLTRLLERHGFEKIGVRSACESGIAGFATFGLDASESGVVRKPDSLFMEARRPL